MLGRVLRALHHGSGAGRALRLRLACVWRANTCDATGAPRVHSLLLGVGGPGCGEWQRAEAPGATQGECARTGSAFLIQVLLLLLRALAPVGGAFPVHRMMAPWGRKQLLRVTSCLQGKAALPRVQRQGERAQAPKLGPSWCPRAPSQACWRTGDRSSRAAAPSRCAATWWTRDGSRSSPSRTCVLSALAVRHHGLQRQ